MPGGCLFVGQVAILAVTCVVAYCCLRSLFTELPRARVLGNQAGIKRAGAVRPRLFSFFLGFTLLSKFLGWLQSVFVHLVQQFAQLTFFY
jgi:uncharacterized membrane protein